MPTWSPRHVFLPQCRWVPGDSDQHTNASIFTKLWASHHPKHSCSPTEYNTTSCSLPRIHSHTYTEQTATCPDFHPKQQEQQGSSTWPTGRNQNTKTHPMAQHPNSFPKHSQILQTPKSWLRYPNPFLPPSLPLPLPLLIATILSSASSPSGHNILLTDSGLAYPTRLPSPDGK